MGRGILKGGLGDSLVVIAGFQGEGPGGGWEESWRWREEKGGEKEEREGEGRMEG